MSGQLHALLILVPVKESPVPLTGSLANGRAGLVMLAVISPLLETESNLPSS
jgi:hypothetical protein